MKLEVGKKYKVRARDSDIKYVEIIAKDERLRYPYIGLRVYKKLSCLKDYVSTYLETGRSLTTTEDACDLIEEYTEPLTQEIWLNVYKPEHLDTFHKVYSTKEEADSYALSERVGRIKVTLKEGQWDE